MAFDANGMFGMGIVGSPQVGGDINVNDTNASCKRALGTVYTRQDGAEFVYSHFGYDTSAGVLVGQNQVDASIVDTDNVVIDPESATAVAGTTVKPGAANSYFVQLTSGASMAGVSANQFAGGYFSVTDGVGKGYVYPIVGNTAIGNPTTGNLRLELYNKLKVALNATSDISIWGSKYSNLRIADSTSNAVVAGISQALMDVSEAPYGWVQKSGVASVLTSGAALAVNDVVVLSSLAGAVKEFAQGVATATSATGLAAEPQLGVCLVVGDNDGQSVIDLQL